MDLPHVGCHPYAFVVVHNGHIIFMSLFTLICAGSCPCYQ